MATFTVGGPTGQTLYPFWTVMNCNGPHRFLDAGYADALPVERPFIREVNAVYLLGGRRPGVNAWYRGRRPDGGIAADFEGLIAQLKAMLDRGLTPRPVLDNVPYEMSDPPADHAFGNTAPPADESVWEAYVEAALRAMVRAFGRERVGRWWFRAGTEPDLSPDHWSGTRAQALEHYRRTAAAFERVLPEGRLGPGNVLNPVGNEYGREKFHEWGLDFFDYCAEHDVRLDWFSCSWYAQVGVSADYFDRAVAMIRERACRHARFRDTPLAIGEFAILYDEDWRRLYDGEASEWGASFYAALARRVYDRGIADVYEWAQTTRGVWHPRAQAIAWLAEMSGGERLAVRHRDRSDLDNGILAARRGDALILLLFNHHAHREPPVAEVFDVTVAEPRVRAGQVWRLDADYLDRDHGVWVRDFEADAAAAGIAPLAGSGRYEGSPARRFGPRGEALFRERIETYRALSRPARAPAERIAAEADGRLRFRVEMPGLSVRRLRLTPG